MNSCAVANASSVSDANLAPIICYQSAESRLGKLAIELCAGAHGDPFTCYISAVNIGLNQMEAIHLCQGS